MTEQPTTDPTQTKEDPQETKPKKKRVKKPPVETRISCYNPVLANKIKHNKIIEPFDLYKQQLQILVDQLLYQPTIPTLLGKSVTSQIPLPSRLSQVLAKQASAIARSIKNKVDIANKAQNKDKYQVEILNKYITRTIKVNVNSVNIELDSRFISITPNQTTKLCDYWIKITSFPKKSFNVPLRLTNHMKDLIKRGYELNTRAIRINSNGSFGVYFERPKSTPRQGHRTLGIDLGIKNLVSIHTGHQETTHPCGHKVDHILDKMVTKKSGSKNFRQTRRELRQQVNYSLKHDIDWTGIDTLIMENLKSMKANRDLSKKLHLWCIGYVIGKIKHLSEENHVGITQVYAAYTSQTCSVCGHKDKSNRHEERFVCVSCGHTANADINAAINIHRRGANSPSGHKNSIHKS
jgi:putative transposase